MTNLTLSVTHQFQSDEIDMVVVGPPGVRVIEVKHWTAKWVNANEKLVEHAAELVTSKARKIGTTLRKVVQNLGFAAFLRYETGTVPLWIILTSFAAVGMLLSASWFFVIRSYRQLNTGKFGTLMELI